MIYERKLKIEDLKKSVFRDELRKEVVQLYKLIKEIEDETA